MNFTHLLLRSEEGITTITINRAKQANALNWETIGELKQAVEATQGTPETRVIVITGAGERTREDCESP
jgi:enoyl-CoA hydratase